MSSSRIEIMRGRRAGRDQADVEDNPDVVDRRGAAVGDIVVDVDANGVAMVPVDVAVDVANGKVREANESIRRGNTRAWFALALGTWIGWLWRGRGVRKG